jgi:two-component system cell cycle sensor histidine kinase/response regulator CckA
VVDDEPAVRNLAKRVLERNGYQVLIAEDGQGAIDAVAGHPEVRAVVLDLAMPVMSGDTAAPLLRAHRPELALILSSGYAESEALERFGRDLLSGFLQKPYTPRALLEKVAEVLSAV